MVELLFGLVAIQQSESNRNFQVNSQRNRRAEEEEKQNKKAGKV